MSHHFIEYRDVHFSYPGEKEEVLKGISFLIKHGEKVAILGLNGAGKSTLILTMNGLLSITEGEISIGGIPITKKTLPIVRQSVGMVFQNADDQLFMPTVEEDIAFGPLNMKLPTQEVERRVSEALQAVGLNHLRKRSSSQLSGGQKRMIAIATVLSMEPNIMVLDEPSAGLDLKARGELIQILEKFQHTCVLATHDIQLAKQICERALIINDGRIVGDVTMTEFIENPALRELIGM